MMIDEKPFNDALLDWLKENGYSIVQSIILSYGHMSLNNNSAVLIKSIRKTRELNNKAMSAFRNKEYQKASAYFINQIEINPFDKNPIAYLAHLCHPILK